MSGGGSSEETTAKKVINLQREGDDLKGCQFFKLKIGDTISCCPG